MGKSNKKKNKRPKQVSSSNDTAVRSRRPQDPLPQPPVTEPIDYQESRSVTSGDGRWKERIRTNSIDGQSATIAPAGHATQRDSRSSRSLESYTASANDQIEGRNKRRHDGNGVEVADPRLHKKPMFNRRRGNFNSTNSSMAPPSRPRADSKTSHNSHVSVVQPAPPSVDMGATKRMSNGEAKPIGPHPSTIKVSQPFMSQAAIEKRLQPLGADPQDKLQAEAREDTFRLQGVAWIDNTRRALSLPFKTFTTACLFYHKFRLAHPSADYTWADAAAASLLTSCKIEDTLKKSRDILAAAWNSKASGHERLGADDTVFDGPSKSVIGLERLVLESSGFDFRSRYPQDNLIKIGKGLPESEDKERVVKLAWTILTDLHRTFAPLKQTSATVAVACLELAARMRSAVSSNGTCVVEEHVQAIDLDRFSVTREEVMETLLDALDLYTHHAASTILGTKYSLDDFLRIRLALNKECNDAKLPRYTTSTPNPDHALSSSSAVRTSNGHPTPVSPGAQPSPASLAMPSVPEGGGTLRFILRPELAAEEKAEVQKYFTEEWEEYEEEIQVPIPRGPSRDRDSSRRDDGKSDRRPTGPSALSTPSGPSAGRRGRDLLDNRRPRDDLRTERERLRARELEVERERARLRERERDRRFPDDRRYDYDRRSSYDRRYDEDRRRRDDRR